MGKKDQFGVTSVNLKHLFNTRENMLDEPFILASQAVQVYYVKEGPESDWYAVAQSKPHDLMIWRLIMKYITQCLIWMQMLISVVFLEMLYM